MRSIAKPLETLRDPLLQEPAREEDGRLEDLVRRFYFPLRGSVRRLVYSSPRMADLAAIFPGAVHALATRRGAAAKRRRAMALVEAGAQLKDVARALDLGLWMRRLPPEAFEDEIAELPVAEMFGRRIINQLPPRPEDSAHWLESVTFGVRACDDYFTIWLAGQPIFFDRTSPARLFGVLAAYAWYSGQEDTPARELIVVPWRPEMALETAVCAAKSWLNRMRLVIQLNGPVLTDPWLQPGESAGLMFEPLLNAADILAEAHAMQNCADQYADRLARDKCRLFSIRRRGTRVATLEIGPHVREPAMLAINQLKARHNMPAPLDVWQATHQWLAGQPTLRRIPPMAIEQRHLSPVMWEQLMRPYRQHKSGVPWLPVDPTHAAFAELDAGIAELARRGGVTSWLFT